MTDPTLSAPEAPASVRSRLNETRRDYHREIIVALDQLPVPQTLVELIAQVTSPDCKMFHAMVGQPRAWMDIYTSIPEFPVIRWVYQVLRWGMQAKRPVAEPQLVAHLWKIFLRLRKQFEYRYPDADPVLIWRRQEEIGVEGGRGTKMPLRTVISMRLAIPGLDLQRDPDFWQECHPYNEDGSNPWMLPVVSEVAGGT